MNASQTPSHSINQEMKKAVILTLLLSFHLLEACKDLYTRLDYLNNINSDLV